MPTTVSSTKFGAYGGQYVPPELKKVLDNLDRELKLALKDSKFKKDYKKLMADYVGRPSPLYLAENLSKDLGASIYLKREDLNHTGSHKINNTIGQALLAKRMGKKKVIAETGAGQHGVATATAAALLGMECDIYMGQIDADKQRMNVHRMQLLGARIIVVSGSLKEAVDAALDAYVKDMSVYYLLGSVVGPHPYPFMVREFQKIIGEETRAQILEKENRLPDYLIACVGGGSNAMGLFNAFMQDKNVKKIGVEPAGLGLSTGKHAATLTLGKPGIIHGFRCYLLQDEKGNPAPVHSIASGLDYPGVGPEHSFFKDTLQAEYATVTDKEALSAFKLLSEKEGIIPALESSHAVAHAITLAKAHPGCVMIINLSGRGDKDVEYVLGLDKNGEEDETD
ncbi:MAG: tryptophan synthase subunit beta [Nanoarchaeota archaeon]|nr:tryptophan synthase subunit beta [Nanoarchaeota archaeon]